MSKIGTIDFAGESGKMYTFNIYSIENNHFKPKGGVFVVTKRTEKDDGRGVHKKLFIGSAEDFSIAFNNHEKRDCFFEQGANCVCTYWEDSTEMRSNIVEDLVDNYHPPCNDQ
ncbi:MAG: hypothetical protein ACNS62_07215 [Candidatus Cyclobacteriaceae bacterium M3_2C_046]